MGGGVREPPEEDGLRTQQAELLQTPQKGKAEKFAFGREGKGREVWSRSGAGDPQRRGLPAPNPRPARRCPAEIGERPARREWGRAAAGRRRSVSPPGAEPRGAAEFADAAAGPGKGRSFLPG